MLCSVLGCVRGEDCVFRVSVGLAFVVRIAFRCECCVPCWVGVRGEVCVSV